MMDNETKYLVYTYHIGISQGLSHEQSCKFADNLKTRYAEYNMTLWGHENPNLRANMVCEELEKITGEKR